MPLSSFVGKTDSGRGSERQSVVLKADMIPRIGINYLFIMLVVVWSLDVGVFGDVAVEFWWK